MKNVIYYLKIIFFPFILIYDKIFKQAKINRVIKEYEYLIREYGLIQEGKSLLSANKRRMVKARVIHLISKGHIKVESKLKKV